MPVLQFYGVLATTASIFVGILTAYLVTRLSDLKSERERVKRRIAAIDTELEILKTRHEFRIENIQATEERWQQEEAADQVDNFISYNVGDEWSPPPDDVEVQDAVNAMIEYRNITEDELIQTHVDTLEERWDEVIDELETTPYGIAASVAVSEPAYEAANWIRETLWEIYEQEKYDSHDTEALNIQRKAEELEERRAALEDQYDSLDPEQLEESVKATIVPIGLSVVLPLFIRLLHELGWTVSVPYPWNFLEPVLVWIAWLIGFLWTLNFVWTRIQETDDGLSNSPLVGTDLAEEIDLD